MPDISKLKASLECKVDMKNYFAPDGFITIRKLTKSSKKKLQVLSADTMISKIAFNMSKEKDFDENAKLTQKEIGRRYIELSKDDREDAMSVATIQEEIYLVEGVDPTKHNLTEDGKPIELDIDFWEMLPDAALFVIGKVKEFNLSLTEYSLGKPNASK